MYEGVLVCICIFASILLYSTLWGPKPGSPLMLLGLTSILDQQCVCAMILCYVITCAAITEREEKRLSQRKHQNRVEAERWISSVPVKLLAAVQRHQSPDRQQQLRAKNKPWGPGTYQFMVGGGGISAS